MPARFFAHAWTLACDRSQLAPDRASERAKAGCAALRLTQLRLTDLRLTGLQLSALGLAALPQIILQLAWLQLTTLRLTALRKQVWLKVMAVLCSMCLELQRLSYWSTEPCVPRRLTKISPPRTPKGVHPSKTNVRPPSILPSCHPSHQKCQCGPS